MAAGLERRGAVPDGEGLAPVQVKRIIGLMDPHQTTGGPLDPPDRHGAGQATSCGDQHRSFVFLFRAPCPAWFHTGGQVKRMAG